MCYARPPANNDATGDSVVLSLLWPQSSQETDGFVGCVATYSRDWRSLWSIVSEGAHRWCDR
jgi:hypothetical protein